VRGDFEHLAQVYQFPSVELLGQPADLLERAGRRFGIHFDFLFFVFRWRKPLEGRLRDQPAIGTLPKTGAFANGADFV
jgi:hypothetical protein